MLFDLPKDEPSIIKVIGVGGGGSNAVTHMYKQGIVGVDFAICNTDAQAMQQSPIPTRIQLGYSLTEGRGAGSKPTVGRDACIESIEDIKRWLENGTKMVFITAGMGGGTGTGAAPIIAKTAQELGILTVGIVTMPFSFEGRTRVTHGHDGLDELKKSVDTLIVISNDKLRSIHGNLSISQAFSNADNILTTAAKSIAEIITVAGQVNVDFEDVNTVMRDSGVAIMGTAAVEGENRAKRAVDEALNSPLLEDSNIRGAKHILVNITSGTREVTMDEIFEITEFVQNEAGHSTNLIWGNCFDERLGDKLAVTVIATGFEASTKIAQQFGGNRQVATPQPPQDRRVHLEDEVKKSLAPSGIFDITNDEPTMSEGTNGGAFAPSFEFDVAETVDKLRRNPARQADVYVSREEMEQQEAARRRHAEMAAKRKEDARTRPLTMPKLSSPQTVIEMESQPAYLRRNVLLDDVADAADLGMSRWTISVDDEPEIKMSGNSFLHDNVD
jgi:cell division protein FtsZ